MVDLDIPSLLTTYKDNFVRNFTGAFTNLKPEGWIRIVIIIGTYLLVRPYLVKLGAHMQAKQHDKAAAPTDADIHPNELRTGRKVAVPGSDDEEETEARPGDWGKKARVRQRKVVRKMVEEREKRAAEEEDLKDIADLLED